MRSRIIQILIILYSLLTLKMVVDEQWVPVCVLMLFGYVWLIRNWDTDKYGSTAVEKLVYRALILTLVLTAIVAVIESVWWILPVIAFIIYMNLDRV